ASIDSYNENNGNANNRSRTLSILGSAATGGGMVEFASGFIADRATGATGVEEDLTKVAVQGATWATNDNGNLPTQRVTFDTNPGVPGVATPPRKIPAPPPRPSPSAGPPNPRPAWPPAPAPTPAGGAPPTPKGARQPGPTTPSPAAPATSTPNMVTVNGGTLNL